MIKKEVSPLIKAASDLATRAHGAVNHVRKYTGEPYIEQLKAVLDSAGPASS